tara:strand:+ start:1616 stop:1846 length:231 start_codon:yes stop_codon:yes gene_type:complete
MEFFTNIYGIRVDMGQHFFSAVVGQHFNGGELKVMEIVHDHNAKDPKYYIWVENKKGEVFKWQTFENCRVNITENK